MGTKQSKTDFKSVDINNDGKISKDEFENFIKIQEQRFQDLQQKLLDNSKISENLDNSKFLALKLQLQQLHEENSKLSNHIKQLEDKNKENPNPKNVKSLLSRDDIRKYIDKLLENENANVGFLPDFVEKKIYENVFIFLLGLLENTLEQSSIEVLGHKIKAEIQQKSEK